MELGVRFVFDIMAFTSVMVLIVLGLGVIASMMGIFNFAHGELVLLGAYTVYLSDANGLGTWPGIIAAPIVVGAVGYALERTNIKRFYSNPIIAMLGTYAIGLVIREIVRGLLGGLQIHPGTVERAVQCWRARLLSLAHCDHRHDIGRHRRQLAAAVSHLDRCRSCDGTEHLPGLRSGGRVSELISDFYCMTPEHFRARAGLYRQKVGQHPGGN